MIGLSEKSSFCKRLLLMLCLACVVAKSESFWLQTEKSLTAERGGSISLPCEFSVHAHAVYWYKHNFTGATDVGASLVAQDYLGITDPVPGFERFSITRDYSLIISNIGFNDETTYSCLVVENDHKRGSTDLRVIALAEPLEPIIDSCQVISQGRCEYYVSYDNSPEDVTMITLTCGVYNVRPLPDLTWIRSDGKLVYNATHQTQTKYGLFSISSRIQVSKSNLYNTTCQANGEAVKGTSSMTIEDYHTHDQDANLWLIVGIIIAVYIGLFLIMLSPYYGESLYRRYRRFKANGDKTKSNWWCSCGKCVMIKTTVECFCCQDLNRSSEIKTRGCITDSKEFEVVCLNKPYLRVVLSLRKEDHQIPRPMENKSYRFGAYMIWSDFFYGYMGKGVRRPLPACVMTRVREEFPETTGVYVNFECGERGDDGEEESISFLPNNDIEMRAALECADTDTD